MSAHLARATRFFLNKVPEPEVSDLVGHTFLGIVWRTRTLGSVAPWGACLPTDGLAGACKADYAGRSNIFTLPMKSSFPTATPLWRKIA